MSDGGIMRPKLVQELWCLHINADYGVFTLNLIKILELKSLLVSSYMQLSFVCVCVCVVSV